jgi:Innexin.
MALLGLLTALAGFVKVRFLVDKEIIDNVIFRCHYRVTSAILFVFCILCTANSLIGRYHQAHIHELLGLNPN